MSDNIESTTETVEPTKKPSIAHILGDNGLTVYVNGMIRTVLKDHRNYRQIIEAINEGDPEKVARLIDFETSFEAWKGDLPEGFEIRGAVVYFNGRPFVEAISSKVIRMAREGLNPSPLFNFLRKVRMNPSASAQRELLLFCEANGFMIHEDGDMIAYRAVTDDYLDQHSRSVLNKPYPLLTDEDKARLPYTTSGQVTVQIVEIDGVPTTVITMPREEVDDRRNVTCSFGLHFAAFSYASGFSQRILVVKMHPKDVVAIPNDYNNRKGRCCRYEIIGERRGERVALPEKEVYGNFDLSCPPTDAPETDDGDEEKADIERRVKRVIAIQSPSLYEGEIISDTTLNDAGIAENYEVTALVEALANEFGVDLDRELFRDSDDLDEIVRLVTEALNEEPEDEEPEDDDDLESAGEMVTRIFAEHFNTSWANVASENTVRDFGGWAEDVDAIIATIATDACITLDREMLGITVTTRVADYVKFIEQAEVQGPASPVTRFKETFDKVVALLTARHTTAPVRPQDLLGLDLKIEPWQYDGIEEDVEQEFNVRLVDGDLTPTMSVRDLTQAVISKEDEAALHNPVLFTEAAQEEIARETAPLDREKLHRALIGIQGDIVRRIVRNEGNFRQALANAGFSPDRPEVIAAVRDLGLDGWL